MITVMVQIKIFTYSDGIGPTSWECIRAARIPLTAGFKNPVANLNNQITTTKAMPNGISKSKPANKWFRMLPLIVFQKPVFVLAVI